MKLKEILDDYVSRDLIKSTSNGELTIYNYSQKTQFAGCYWDYYTLMARGLILDNDSNIIARPFKKFFNFNERPETSATQLPLDKPEASVKLDGSLIIAYKWKGEWKLATKGSFNSEQAIESMKILKEKHADTNFDKYSDLTLLFECIYDSNRIVINYENHRDLYLIGAVDKIGGYEYSYEEVHVIANELGFTVPNYFINSFDEVFELVKLDIKNTEGYVVYWPKTGLRMKIKTADYIRLHKLITGLSDKTIWEYLKDGKNPDDMLKDMPDEFFSWYNHSKKVLLDKYSDIEKSAKDVFERCPKFGKRKEYAEWIKKESKDTTEAGIIFSMLDNRKYDNKIWKLLEPVGARYATKNHD